MATYTSNYGWTKPSGSDNVDISVLNNNLDDQDSTIHDAFLNMAPPFSESSTYAVDDIVLYGTGLYKCHTAVVTPGSWTGSTNWQVYKLSEGGSGGGGGTTNYNALTNKPQINSVELSGNKTSAQLGLMASDGVVANPTGQTTGTLTALEVGGTKYAVGGGSGTSDYTDLTNKPSINGVELSGNKTTSDLGIKFEDLPDAPTLGTASSKDVPASGDASSSQVVMGNDSRLTDSRPASDVSAWAKQATKPTYTAADVGLGNVPNVSTNDQTPTFTEASTRNNIASGEKLSVILGKIQKFFNDLKTVAFSGSYTDLTNKPTIPAAQVNSDWNASSGVAEILNKPSSYKPSSHLHGNIQNNGTLQTTDIAVANGDKLVVTDSSNSAKIARTSVAFDGTTTTQALSKKGTFETFSKFSGSFTDLTNKPENANTFQGTIAEWNQLTTAEKKAYDHASIPDSLDGNVTFPASKVMMNDGASVEDRVDANTFGTAVNIASYTSSNKYTCPSDGYVTIHIGSNNSGTLIVDEPSANLSIGGFQGRYSLFVKKGLKLYIDGSPARAYFYPLS